MCDALVKIVPIGIEPFDLPQFPVPLPFLHLQLSLPCGFNAVMRLVPDEMMTAIFLGEAGRDLIAMFPDPLCEIAGYPDVDRSVTLACHDIDEAGFLHH